MSINYAQLYKSFVDNTQGKSLKERFDAAVVYNDKTTGYGAVGQDAAQKQRKNEHFGNYLLQAAIADSNDTLSAEELDKATGIGIYNAQLFINHHKLAAETDMSKVAEKFDIWQSDFNGDGILSGAEKRDFVEQLYADVLLNKTSEELVNQFKEDSSPGQAAIRFGRNYNASYNAIDYNEQQSWGDAYDYLEAAAGDDAVLQQEELKAVTGFSDEAIQYLFATNSTLEDDMGTGATLLAKYDAMDGAHNGVIAPEVKAQIEEDAQQWLANHTPCDPPSTQPVTPDVDVTDSDDNAEKTSPQPSATPSSRWSIKGALGGLFGKISEKGSKLRTVLVAALVVFGASALLNSD